MRVSLVNLLIIGGALLAALLLALLAHRLTRWRHDVALRRHGAPVLVMPLVEEPVAPRQHISRDVFPVRSSPATVRRITPTPVAHSPTEEDADVLLVADEPAAHRRTRPVEIVEDRGDRVDRADRRGGHFVEGSGVRFYRAEEGTLEFLPGRLEIVSGGDVGQEIHFMRQVGEEDATITFGRSEGPALRHVQLLDPTVSRQHARLAYSAGRWHLSNMSMTNPVTMNGSALPATGRPITLQDGDRIEMGAVVFLFRER